MKKKQLPLGVKIIRRLFLILFSLLLLPLYYFIGCIPRNKNLWIFCSWFGERYSDNSRILFEYVNKNHPDIKSVWFSKNKNIVSMLQRKGFNALQSYSLKSFLYSIRAGKIFTTTGKELSLFFCRGIEYYALWHGMPLKKIMQDDKISGERATLSSLRRNYCKILHKLFPWQSFISQQNVFTITNSEFFVQFLKSAFNLSNDKVLRTGSPRCDAFFCNRKEPLIEKIREKYPDSKIILYMPTFRTSSWTGKIFDPFSEKYGFNIENFLSALERHKSVVIYKPHFYDAAFLQSLRQKNIDSRFIPITDDDFDELYNFTGQIDILATDYSSIYFDFIVMRKPVILLPFDYEDYIKYAREHYFNYFENMEGVKAKNWHEFIKILEEQSYYSVSDETRLKFAEYLDGNCCEKLMKEIKAL